MATFNRKGPLKRLLDSVAKQTLPVDQFSVSVAIDGSTDGTNEALESWRKLWNFPVKICQQPNQGAAKARDLAIRGSAGVHIVVTDDDMELVPGFLAAHLAAQRKDPKAVVLGAIAPGSALRRKPLYDALGEMQRGELESQMATGQRVPGFDGFATGNVSFPRHLYESVGGFDFGLRVDEDRELGVRMQRAGAVFIFANEARAYHHSDIGHLSSWMKRQELYGHLSVRVWTKHERTVDLHPMRNLIGGHGAKRLGVQTVALFPAVIAPLVILLVAVANVLRYLGVFKAGVGLFRMIQSILFVRGLSDELGNWRAFRQMMSDFRNL